MSSITDLFIPAVDSASKQIWREFLDTTLTTVRLWKWSPRMAEDSTRIAVIIEPRNHCDLEYVIRNVSHFLGPEFKIILFHGRQNIPLALYLQSILPGLYLSPLAHDNLCSQEYNQILLSIAFWDHFPATSKVVVFQTDSIMLRFGMEEFMEYDYVGSPWHDGEIGNGGFSLRDRDCMLQVLQQFTYDLSLNEDGWFSRHVSAVGGKLAPRSVGNEFGAETTLLSTSPLAVHNIASYLQPNEVRLLLKYKD